MPDIDLDAIDARLAGRTPGDWELGHGWVYTDPIYADDTRLTPIGHAARYSDPARQAAEWDRVQRDLELIAAAPTDLAALVAEVRTLRAVVERVGTNPLRSMEGRIAADLNAHATTELRATTADLAVAVEVARERGEEVERLRDDVFTLRADARMADDISRDRARERAEITRLRAVADAARAFLAAWERGEDETHAIDEADDLRAALDAWRAGGGA